MMAKKTTRARPRGGTRHREGVLHAWSLPRRSVLSLGVDGELTLWDLRSGTKLFRPPTASPVLFGSLIGSTFCFVTKTGQLATYDVQRREPLTISELPPDCDAEQVRRIERLGDAHLSLFTRNVWTGDQVHVVGPFPGLSFAEPARQAEYGIPLLTHAVVGDAILSVKRVPVMFEPLNRGRRTRFFVAKANIRKMGKVTDSFCIAGNRIITLERNVDDYCDSLKGRDRELWAWDLSKRRFVGRVGVLDEVEGGGYLFPEKGDMDDPILQGALGFPSGRVLSWGPQHLHLWRANDLTLELLLPRCYPDGAFLTDTRLVVWRSGAITSWRLRLGGDELRHAKMKPVNIEAHPSGVTGVCHLGGAQVLSWSREDPVLRVWSVGTGKYVRGLGE